MKNSKEQKRSYQSPQVVVFHLQTQSIFNASADTDSLSDMIGEDY